jgi:hypothetical protein
MNTLNLHRPASVIIMLIAAANASAGSDMTAAPVKASMKLDRTRAPVGATVKVRFKVRPLQDLPSLEFLIKTNGCATQRAPAAPHVVHDVKTGKPIVVTASFTVTQTKQCMIVGEVLTINDGTTRLGSVFHVMLNPEPPPPDKGRLRTNPEGGKVIEYPSATR